MMYDDDAVAVASANGSGMMKVGLSGYRALGSCSFKALLLLYAARLNTGIALEMGNGETRTVAVYEAHVVQRAVQTTNLAGRILTDHLMNIRTGRGYAFTKSLFQRLTVSLGHQEGSVREHVLAGGTSMFSGIEDRMQKEVTALASSTMEIKIIASSWPPKHSAWLGGSVLASVLNDRCKEKWITKQDYDESGPDVVHHKCYMFFYI